MVEETGTYDLADTTPSRADFFRAEQALWNARQNGVFADLSVGFLEDHLKELAFGHVTLLQFESPPHSYPRNHHCVGEDIGEC